MLPSFRIIAYHRDRVEVVSDSVWVDVIDTCMGSVRRSWHQYSRVLLCKTKSHLKYRLQSFFNCKIKPLFFCLKTVVVEVGSSLSPSLRASTNIPLHHHRRPRSHSRPGSSGQRSLRPQQQTPPHSEKGSFSMFSFISFYLTFPQHCSKHVSLKAHVYILYIYNSKHRPKQLNWRTFRYMVIQWNKISDWSYCFSAPPPGVGCSEEGWYRMHTWWRGGQHERVLWCRTVVSERPYRDCGQTRYSKRKLSLSLPS